MFSKCLYITNNRTQHLLITLKYNRYHWKTQNIPQYNKYNETPVCIRKKCICTASYRVKSMATKLVE